nr:MAG TPA: hypothetical protein [Inoviridae sp.]
MSKKSSKVCSSYLRYFIVFWGHFGKKKEKSQTFLTFFLFYLYLE